MTPFTLMACKGALVCTACGLLALSVAVVALQHWRDSVKWRRFVALHDDESRALMVLEVAELNQACERERADAEAAEAARVDALMRRGFRMAVRRGLNREHKP